MNRAERIVKSPLVPRIAAIGGFIFVGGIGASAATSPVISQLDSDIEKKVLTAGTGILLGATTGLSAYLENWTDETNKKLLKYSCAALGGMVTAAYTAGYFIGKMFLQ